MTKDDFNREYPELFKLWATAPIALGLENSTEEWLKFAEYVRKTTSLPANNADLS
jgi:hypothetical protein